MQGQKRSHSPQDQGFPPLPALTGDIILDVFTDRSLRPADCSKGQFPDNERLAELGGKVLSTAVTQLLFLRIPPMKSQEMAMEREKILSAAHLDMYVQRYELRKRLRCHPDVIAFKFMNSPEEGQILFHAYVGGVFIQRGIGAVQDWIGILLDPSYRPINPASDRHPFKKKKGVRATASESPVPSSSAQLVNQPNPLAPAQPNLAFLPLFNQTAAQRHVVVEYPAEFLGPAHAGKWSVRCIANGIEKGHGIGSSKQLAKEEAARQAYYAMGWAPHG